MLLRNHLCFLIFLGHCRLRGRQTEGDTPNFEAGAFGVPTPDTRTAAADAQVSPKVRDGDRFLGPNRNLWLISDVTSWDGQCRQQKGSQQLRHSRRPGGGPLC